MPLSIKTYSILMGSLVQTVVVQIYHNYRIAPLLIIGFVFHFAQLNGLLIIFTTNNCALKLDRKGD